MNHLGKLSKSQGKKKKNNCYSILKEADSESLFSKYKLERMHKIKTEDIEDFFCH
jgi:hypothetical protein